MAFGANFILANFNTGPPTASSRQKIVRKKSVQLARQGSRASNCEQAEKALEEADAYNYYLQCAL